MVMGKTKNKHVAEEHMIKSDPFPNTKQNRNHAAVRLNDDVKTYITNNDTGALEDNNLVTYPDTQMHYQIIDTTTYRIVAKVSVNISSVNHDPMSNVIQLIAHIDTSETGAFLEPNIMNQLENVILDDTGVKVGHVYEYLTTEYTIAELTTLSLDAFLDQLDETGYVLQH